jgi:hypothetical protein
MPPCQWYEIFPCNFLSYRDNSCHTEGFLSKRFKIILNKTGYLQEVISIIGMGFVLADKLHTN